MRSRQTGQSQDVAAAKSGVSVRSGRRIERGERIHAPRTWRTREDPLSEVWETHLAPLLAQAPDLTGLTLLEYLEDTFSGRVRRAHPAHLTASGAALEGGAWAG